MSLSASPRAGIRWRAAAALAVVGAIYGACSSRSSTPDSGRPQATSNASVARIVQIDEYAPVVVGAEGAAGAVYFWTARRRISVLPDSSATIRETPLQQPRLFASRGPVAFRPRLKFDASTTRDGSGGFSFLPIGGPPLTYADVQRLPSTPAGMTAVLRSHIRAPASAVTSAGMLRLYGFLLGLAPLTRRRRATAAAALRTLPGIRACGVRDGPLMQFCASDQEASIGVWLDARTDRVVRVAQRLAASSPLYPGLRPTTLLQMDQFLRVSTSSTGRT